MYNMTPQASDAIFQWSRPTTTPEYGKPVLRRQDWHDPVLSLACEIQNLAIEVDDGEETWIDEQSIPINKILPYALRLLDALEEHPDKTIGILHRQLKKWVQSRQAGRAYNIKSIVFQICGVLTDPRPQSKQDDLEF